jgi:CBS domain-containing protein
MLKDVMCTNLVTVEPNVSVSEAAKLMDKENVGCVLVLENDMPRGIITDRDIVVRCIAQNIDVDDCTVENVMTEALQTVSQNEGIYDGIRKMREAGVRRLPIVDDNGKAVGILSFGDIAALLAKEAMELTETTTSAAEQRLGKEPGFRKPMAA